MQNEKGNFHHLSIQKTMIISNFLHSDEYFFFYSAWEIVWPVLINVINRNEVYGFFFVDIVQRNEGLGRPGQQRPISIHYKHLRHLESHIFVRARHSAPVTFLAAPHPANTLGRERGAGRRERSRSGCMGDKEKAWLFGTWPVACITAYAGVVCAAFFGHKISLTDFRVPSCFRAVFGC